MTEVEIFAGICGFTTKVSCEDKGSYKALFNLDSEYLNWQKSNELIGGKDIEVMAELFKKQADQ